MIGLTKKSSLNLFKKIISLILLLVSLYSFKVPVTYASIKFSRYFHNMLNFAKKHYFITGALVAAELIAILSRFLNINRDTGVLENADEEVLKRDFKLYIFNVGRADAAVLKYNDFTLMIDGGNVSFLRNRDLMSILKKHCIRKLNYLALTHPHVDHFGQMNEIIKRIAIENFLYSASPKELFSSFGYKNKVKKNLLEKKVKKLKIKAGYDIIVPENDIGLSIKVIGPVKKYEKVNNNSLVFLIKVFNQKILLMGDAEKESEIDIMNYCEKNNIDIKNVTYIKMGHHGSNTSSCKKFVKFTNPKIALASTGKHSMLMFNLFNFHLSPRRVRRYKAINSKFYSTQFQNDLLISLNRETKKLELNKIDNK